MKDRSDNKNRPSLKDGIVISVSVFALFISIKSCDLSKQAIEISKQSSEISNRPYLTLMPVKFSKTDSYFMITNDLTN